MTMSDRIAVMRHGRILQVGEPREVYEDPVNEFVAGFLGASNLVPGEVRERTDGVVVVALSGGALVRVPTARFPDGAAAVKVGVRPEKITIQPRSEEAPPGANSVSGTLRMATYIGVSHQFRVEGPGGAELTVYVQNLDSSRAPRPGEEVRLVWRQEDTFAVAAEEAAAEEETEGGI